MKKLALALILASLLVSMGAQVAWAAPGEASCPVHVVQPGENLFRIALRYGTSVSAIAAANHIYNPNLIYVGQRLILPCGVPSPVPPPSVQTRYYVRPGDNLFRISLRFGVSVQAIAAANHIADPSRIYAGQCLIIPCGKAAPPPVKHGFHYTVHAGDTLAGIAFRFGVNLYTLAAANHITNLNLIFAGQVLFIP
jgi:LysM repeat protein